MIASSVAVYTIPHTIPPRHYSRSTNKAAVFAPVTGDVNGRLKRDTAKSGKWAWNRHTRHMHIEHMLSVYFRLYSAPCFKTSNELV